MAILFYQIAAALIMMWSFFYLCAQRSGVVGKLIHFMVAVEAGAVCFPATLHLPATHSTTFIIVLVAAVFYNEAQRKVYHD